MKICLLSHSDGRNGGYAAAYRLHQGLQQINLDSIMLVGDKRRDDFTVISPESLFAKTWIKLAFFLDDLPRLIYPNRENTFYSLQWFPDRIAAKVATISPDLINLHWINGGYLQIETLRQFQQPIVWTLHDMWAFTGGCHYSQGCERYQKSCGSCPQLDSNQNCDLSRWVWHRKSKAWKNLNLTLVTPSNWLADCAKSSSLLHSFPITVIPNGVDTQCYKPIEKKLARMLLGLPLDQKIILFGSSQAARDHRKGFHLLLPALQKLSQSQGQNQIEIVIFGASQPREPPNFGFKTHYLGILGDDISLSLVYAAADVFIAPSVEDNLPNTVLEAMACGTPCVAFKIGGMSDMIDHEQNGYLAEPFSIEDLARGIIWIIENPERHKKLREYARQKVEQEFTLEKQAFRYLSLFQEVSQCL